MLLKLINRVLLVGKLIFEENGGHGMIFKTFEGKLMITLHQPNNGERERTKLYELIDNRDYLKLSKLIN